MRSHHHGMLMEMPAPQMTTQPKVDIVRSGCARLASTNGQQPFRVVYWVLAALSASAIGAISTELLIPQLQHAITPFSVSGTMKQMLKRVCNQRRFGCAATSLSIGCATSAQRDACTDTEPVHIIVPYRAVAVLVVRDIKHASAIPCSLCFLMLLRIGILSGMKALPMTTPLDL